MNGLILWGILGYLIVILGIGYWSSKKIKNFSDFLVAGRRLPFFLSMAALFATWFGAGSCMGASGTTYSVGLRGVIADPFAAGLALIIAGIFYVGLLRRMALLTVTDIFGKYYGKGAEIFASILMIPVYIGWLGAQMVAIGYIGYVLTGIDPTFCILIGGFIVLFYTLEGGMWAVTLTDFLQFIVLIAGLIIILPPVLGHVGGLKELIRSTPGEYWQVLPASRGYNDWVSYIGQWAMMGLGCVVGQDLIQRSLSSKNERVAKSSAVTAGVLYILVGLIPITLGLAGRLIMPGLEDPEQIMPNLAIKFLPPVMLVIFMGALISAIMSSASGSLLAVSSLTSRNIIIKMFPHVMGDRFLLLVRLVTFISAVVSIGLALYVKQIYHLMVNSWATLFVGIFVPVTAALYWKKANRLAAWVSMILGTGTWLGVIIFGGGSLQEIEDHLFYRASVYGGIASLISYLAITIVRYKKIEPVKTASEYPKEGVEI